MVLYKIKQINASLRFANGVSVCLVKVISVQSNESAFNFIGKTTQL